MLLIKNETNTMTKQTNTMTKQKKLVRNAIKGFLSLVVLSLFTTFISCDHDRDDESQKKSTPTTAHNVVFKAEVSAGSTINSAMYGFNGEANVQATGVSGTVWTSPETKIDGGGILVVKVNATGANASSNLKVQILVDGVVKKEVTSTGQALTAQFAVQL